MPFRLLHVEWRIDSLVFATAVIVVIAFFSSKISGELRSVQQTNAKIVVALSNTESLRSNSSVSVEQQIGALKKELDDVKSTAKSQDKLTNDLQKKTPKSQ